MKIYAVLSDIGTEKLGFSFGKCKIFLVTFLLSMTIFNLLALISMMHVQLP